MMIAIGINERRNIVPAEKLAADIADANSDGVPEGRSAKYFLDMNSRKLPPPLVFWSEREKDAYIRNRSVQTKLSREMEHLQLEERVREKEFQKDLQITRVRSARFEERASAIMRRRSLNYEVEEVKDTDRKMPRPRAKSASYANRSSDVLNTEEYESLQPLKEVTEFGWTPDSSKRTPREPNVQKSLLEIITDEQEGEEIPPESRLSGVSIAVPETKIRSHSVMLPLRRNKPRDGPADMRTRSKSSVPGRRGILLNGMDVVPEGEEVASTDPQLQRRDSELKESRRRSSCFSSSRAESELKKELRRLRRKPKQKGIQHWQKVEWQKLRTQVCQSKVDAFCDKIKKLSTRKYTKWDMKELEEELHL